MLYTNNEASAREWVIKSNVLAEVEHNDNIFLTSDDKKSSTGLFVTPKVNLTVREPIWNASLDASVKGSYYNRSGLNSNDIFLGTNNNFKTERSIYSLSGRYITDTNLNALSNEFGLADTRVRSKTANYSPSYTYLYSERLNLNIAYTHNSVTYHDAANTGFTSSNSDTYSGELTYRITELHDFILSTRKMLFERSDKSVEFDLLSYSTGINSRLTETLTSRFSVGRSINDQIIRNTGTPFNFFGTLIFLNDEEDRNNRNTVYNLSVNKEFHNQTLNVTLSKDDTTDSFGGLNNVERAGIALAHNASDKMKYIANLVYTDTDSVSTTTTFLDRKFMSINLSLHYAVQKNWNFKAGYRYNTRDFETNSGDSRRPVSNIISVSLTYNIPEVSSY